MLVHQRINWDVKINRGELFPIKASSAKINRARCAADMFQCFMFHFMRVHYAPKKSLVHTSKVDLPLSHTLQPPITHLIQYAIISLLLRCSVCATRAFLCYSA